MTHLKFWSNLFKIEFDELLNLANAYILPFGAT